MKIRKNLFAPLELVQFLKRHLFSLTLPQGVFLVYFFSSILIFTFFIPPFQKGDEQTHFWKAMALAKGQFQCKNENGTSYFVLSNSIINFPDQMHVNTVMMRQSVKFPVGALKQKYPFRNDYSENTSYRFCIFPSLGYVPYALGALISYPLNNLLFTFYFMRIISAIVFIISVVVSLIIIPKRYQGLLLFFSSIPMVIHQATAISYDAGSYSLGILLFSLLCMLLDKKKISPREFAVFIFVTVLFSLVKFGYYFVYIFPFLLLTKLKMTNLRFYIISRISFILAFLGYFLFADNASAVRSSLLSTQTSSQIYMLIHHPLQFLLAVKNAAFLDSHDLIQGLIGHFGWLDYTLSPVMTYSYVLIGGIVLYTTVRNDRITLSLFATMWFFIAVVFNFLLVFSYFYMKLTPTAYYAVIGTQGRYFIIFLPFLVYGVSQSIQNIRHSRILQALFVGIVAIFFLLSIGKTVYNRYFYYGRSFSNPNALVERLKNEKLELSTLVQISVAKPISFVSSYPIDGNKIGGFQLLIFNERFVTIPYQYVLKDASCTKMLHSGFLDRIKGPRMSHLLGKDDVVYTQYVPVTSVSGKSFCLELNPLPIQGGTPLILLGTNFRVPIVEFLSIIQ